MLILNNDSDSLNVLVVDRSSVLSKKKLLSLSFMVYSLCLILFQKQNLKIIQNYFPPFIEKVNIEMNRCFRI